jgi:hypothetical protein
MEPDHKAFVSCPLDFLQVYADPAFTFLVFFPLPRHGLQASGKAVALFLCSFTPLVVLPFPHFLPFFGLIFFAA